MPLREIVAEIQARGNGYTGDVQQLETECLAVGTKAAAIGVQIKCALGEHGNTKTHIAQGRQQMLLGDIA